MPGCRINYNLNIIDTPGFGDCRGIERDKKIVEQIKKFFSSSQDHGIECLDAVWFVTQAPMCKLTPTQRYIFDSVLSIFGADIKENIFVLITFADSQQPPVLHAIKEADIPHQGTFKFNNSALFVNPSISPDDKVAWKMGKKGFEEFFTGLRKVRTKSLTLTKEVLQLRKKLEDHISRIQKEIMRGTEEQLKMREEERILKLHERDIADNMNFKYKVKEVKVVKIDLPTGIHTTTCLICNFTCHEDCIYANDDHKMLCWAMDQNFCQDCLAKPEPERVGCWCSMNKHCRICENRCIWSEHKNQPYLIQAQEIYAEKTYEEMMKKYVSAQDEKGKAINILEKIKENYETVMERNKELVAKVKDYINRLKEIALKPNPMSELDYINILIENENEGKKDGYQERIHILKELHEKAKIRAQIAEELDKEDTSLKLNKRLNQGYSSTNTESPKQINRMKSSTSIASNTHTVTPKQTNRSIPAVKTVARTQPTITKQINQIKPSVSAELDKENSLLDSSNLTEREDLDSPTLPNKDNTNFVQSGQNAKSISPEHKNHMGPSVNTVTEYTPNQAHQMENVHAATKKSKMCHVM